MSEDCSIEAEDLLTPQELAERLQVGLNWVYEKRRSRGEHSGRPLPVLRCGRYLRFYWPDVCEWLRSGTNQSATAARKTTSSAGQK
jgi:hypothetical protein